MGVVGGCAVSSGRDVCGCVAWVVFGLNASPKEPKVNDKV